MIELHASAHPTPKGVIVFLEESGKGKEVPSWDDVDPTAEEFARGYTDEEFTIIWEGKNDSGD